jgi:flagellar hook-associated protein 1
VQAASGNAGFATLLGGTAVGLDGVGGRQFFQGTGAADLALSSAVAGSPDNVAAGAAGNGPLDGSVALGLADLATSTTGADSLYRSVIVGLGVSSQAAQRRVDMQNQTVDQVDGARQSSSSVNTDEEMVQMVQYQHAYEAAARYMTTVDSVLDTLINRTGMTA